MKTIILLVCLCLGAMSFTACNGIKVKAAEKAQKVVEKQLTEAYAGIEMDGYSCAAEVELIGEKTYEKVASFLKVKEEMEGASAFTASGLLQPVCVFVGQQILPNLLRSASGDKYKCLGYIGAEGLKKISFKLCNYI